MPAGSAGNFCLGAMGLGRYVGNVQSSGPSGTMHQAIDVNTVPVSAPGSGHVLMLQPGSTHNFQFWNRDGGTTNFTDALRVTFIN